MAPIEMDHGRSGGGRGRGVDVGDDSDEKRAAGRGVGFGVSGTGRTVGGDGDALAGLTAPGQLAEDNWCYKSLLKIGRAYQKRCCEPRPPNGTPCDFSSRLVPSPSRWQTVVRVEGRQRLDTHLLRIPPFIPLVPDILICVDRFSDVSVKRGIEAEHIPVFDRPLLISNLPSPIIPSPSLRSAPLFPRYRDAFSQPMHSLLPFSIFQFRNLSLLLPS